MTSTLDIATIRKSFPILDQEVNGYPLVYLDNAATTQKPQQVIDVLSDYYKSYNANIHRGFHHLANIATSQYKTLAKRHVPFSMPPVKQRSSSPEEQQIPSIWWRKPGVDKI